MYRHIHVQDTPCSIDNTDIALLGAAVIASCHAFMPADGFASHSVLVGM